MAVDRELGAGSWSYFGDPRAISHDGRHVHRLDLHDRQHLGRPLHGRRQLTKRVIFKGLGRDDHNNPSLVFRHDGHIMVFFSPHSGHHLPPPGIPSVMRYMVSLNPYSIDGFGQVHTVPTNVPGGLGYTYPNPIQLADRLWLFWRGGAWNPTFSYTEDGIHWVPARELCTSATRSGRTRSTSATARRTIHGIFTDGHPENWKNSLHYMRYEGKTLFAASGREARHAEPGAAAHLQARPHLQLLRPGRARLGARHRAHRRGPAAGRLHAPGRQPRHLLLRLPQRHEVDQPQDHRGRRRAARPSTRAARRSTTRIRAFVYLSRTIGRWNQVEQWFTPDDGPHVDAPAAHRPTPTATASARSRPAGCGAPTGSSTSGATSARSASPTTRRASTRSTSRRGTPPTSGGCRSVQAVGGAVVVASAVAAQLDVRDAQRQQPVRMVGEAALTSRPEVPAR